MSCLCMAVLGVAVFRVGIMSDTHVTTNRASFARLEKAYALFKSKGVDLIVNCGDIAERFAPKAYTTYAEVRREAYPDPKAAPDELYCWAWHDAWGYGGKLSESHLEPYPEVKRLLGMTNEPYEERVYAGFPFLVFPQWLDKPRYESTLARVCAANPGKPVFVFDHVPPQATTEDSIHWGDTYRRDVLSRHPQVIVVSGHAHGSLRDERNIWQGAFTAVSAGCLTFFDGDFPGKDDNVRAQNHSVLVMELFSDRAVFRRYSVVDGSEIGAADPWVVHWPYDPKTAAQADENWSRRHARPAFPAGAVLSVEPRSPGQRASCPLQGTSLSVSWPAAADDSAVQRYRLELRRNGRRFALREQRGDFWKEPGERRLTYSDNVDAGYFTPGERVTIAVYPVDFRGNAGSPLMWEGVPDLPRGELVWEGLPKGIKKGEWFESPDWRTDYPLPFVLPKDGKYRCIVDLEADQDERGTVSLCFCGEGVRWPPECSTPIGRTDLRYVMLSGEWKKGDSCALRICFPTQGKLRIRNVRIERIRSAVAKAPHFDLRWEHRFVFEAERALPGGYAFLPAAHYSAIVEKLPAEMRFARENEIVARFAAPTNVAPPYVMHLMATGAQKTSVFVTKDGETSLGSIASWPKGFEPRSAALTNTLRLAVSGGMRDPKASLSAGIGQADTRFVTWGRTNRPYVEDGRLFFTFSARAYGAYLGVMSFNPDKCDFRLEGIILFDYGDGLLRNDLAADLFYDDEAKEWRAYASNFSTGTDSLNGRAKGGINVAWSKSCPLRGVSVMRAKSLGLDGMNEDPDGYWDAEAGRWRLLVSEFTAKGIRAALLESECWDGPFHRIAGPVAEDSTGTTLAVVDGRLRALAGSADRTFYIYDYPTLEKVGKLNVVRPTWEISASDNGRSWPAYAEFPDGRRLLLTFDRVNFAGMPKPNWTYGGLYLYVNSIRPCWVADTPLLKH